MDFRQISHTILAHETPDGRDTTHDREMFEYFECLYHREIHIKGLSYCVLLLSTIIYIYNY